MYYLLGGAGYKNFGDELMVRGWLDWLSAEYPEVNIVVDGAKKENIRDTFGVSHPKIIPADLTNRLASSPRPASFWDAVIRGLTFFDRKGPEKYPTLANDINLLMQASVVHLHGGGYLNKHFKDKGFLLGIAVGASRLTGAKLIATGVGITPLDKPDSIHLEKLGDFLQQFSVFETRDAESANFLKESFDFSGVISGLDDTFVTGIQYAPTVGKKLHLSWSDGRIGDDEFDRVKSYVQDNSGKYSEIIFWKCAPNDHQAWMAIKEICPVAKMLDFDDLVGCAIPVSENDHMLTSRFHPHLIGARGGAAGGYYSHGAYYDVKHGSIVKLGSGFFEIENREISFDDFEESKNKMKANMNELRDRKVALAKMAYTK